jgi:hypothetical protein
MVPKASEKNAMRFLLKVQEEELRQRRVLRHEQESFDDLKETCLFGHYWNQRRNQQKVGLRVEIFGCNLEPASGIGPHGGKVEKRAPIVSVVAKKARTCERKCCSSVDNQ